MDKADYGKRRLAWPVLVIWGSNSHCGRHYKPMEAWAEWADDLRGFAVPTGHYPAEQRPDLILDAFQAFFAGREPQRSEEHTSELQSLMRNSYAVFCLKKKNNT